MKTLSTLLLTLALLAPFGVFADAPVNINQASAAELSAGIVGIGAARAEAVVAWREINGPFKSIDDLALVKGVGQKTVDKNRDRLTVGSSVPVR